MILSILIAQNLGPEGIGGYHFALKIMIIISSISQLGMTNLIIRDLNKENLISSEESKNRYLNKVLWTQINFSLIISVLISFFIIITKEMIEDYFSDSIYFLLFFIILCIPNTLITSLNSIYISKNKLWQGEILSNASDKIILTFIVGVALLTEYEIGLTPLAISRFLIGVLILLIMLYSLKEVKLKSPDFMTRNMLGDAMPIFQANIFTLIGKNIDIFLIGYFLSVKELGIYAVASRIPALIYIVITSMSGEMSPTITQLYYKNKIRELNVFIQKYIRLGVIVSIIGLIFSIIFGKIILLLWGTEFQEGYTVFVLLVASQTLNLSSIGSSMSLTICGLQKKVRSITIYGIVLKIVLITIFMYYNGIIGIALGDLVHSLIINIVKVVVNKKHLGLKFYLQPHIS